MADILLERLFEIDRWEEAINIGVGKDINKGDLRDLTSPETRIAIYQAIKNDTYCIAPPHQTLIPKDTPGEFRTVYVNENVDRILLSIINNLLFEMFPEMIHPTCKSYQRGIGCGKVVKEVSSTVVNTLTNDVGIKIDLSKYFDSVDIEYIDRVFNTVEQKTGQSKVINMLRRYYHSDLCFTPEGELVEKYQSLKQGCAVASWLADVMLYNIDKTISEMPDVYYVRYSDDILILGNNYKSAFDKLASMLSDMSLTLNPKKLETIYKDKWFKFLGFNIKGPQITISKSRVKTFQKEIENRTIKQKKATPKSALNQVNNFLYKGDGTYSWATSILPIINVQKDINILNSFVMDCLRAVETKKTRLGGIGSTTNNDDYTLMRGTGRNVKANKAKTAKIIPEYMTLNCARNALLTSRDAYDTLVRQL